MTRLQGQAGRFIPVYLEQHRVQVMTRQMGLYPSAVARALRELWA